MARRGESISYCRGDATKAKICHRPSRRTRTVTILGRRLGRSQTGGFDVLNDFEEFSSSRNMRSDNRSFEIQMRAASPLL
jgi:hypothetical protein